MPTAALIRHIDAAHRGLLRPGTLMEAFREAFVICPLATDGGFWTGDLGGIRWLYAFTTPAELSRFAAARDAADGSHWPYMTVRGFRLWEEALPSLGVPAGVAVDVAGERPMLFPWMAGRGAVS